MKPIVETIEILNTAALMKGIERSRDDAKAGRVHKIKDVSELDEIWA